MNSAGLSSGLVDCLIKFDLNSWDFQALDFEVCSCNLFCLLAVSFIYIYIYLLDKNFPIVRTEILKTQLIKSQLEFIFLN